MPVLRLALVITAGLLGAALLRLVVQLDWGQAGSELDKPRYAAISQIIGAVLGGLIGLIGVWWADRRATRRPHAAQQARAQELLAIWPPPRLLEASPDDLGVAPSPLAERYRPQGADRPPYVPRSTDPELARLLSEQSLVLVTGRSRAGKSRTAFEVAAKHSRLRNARLLIPRTDQRAEAGGAGGARAEVRKTRMAKAHEDMATLHERWRAQDVDRGLDTVAEVQAALGRDRTPPAPSIGELGNLDEVLDDVVGPAGVTEQATTFTRHDVIRALRPRVGPVPAAQLEELADQALRSERVVAVTGLDARLARWTTPEVLAVEHELVTGAQARRGEQVAVATHAAVRATLAEYDTLGPDQRAMVEDLVRGGGVAVVVGRAGTGKTYALAAARHAWDLAGIEVIGAAPTGIAADELAAGAGIEATSTVDALLHNLGRSPAERARLRARADKLTRHLATVTDPSSAPRSSRTSSNSRPGSTRPRCPVAGCWWWTRLAWLAPASSPPWPPTRAAPGASWSWSAMTSSCSRSTWAAGFVPCGNDWAPAS